MPIPLSGQPHARKCDGFETSLDRKAIVVGCFTSRNTPSDMQINFDKARKLIDELEAKLNETSSHTTSARKALEEWIQSGETRLRKKGASALKQVRKRADSFTKSLTKLEENLAASLEKMSDSLEKDKSGKPLKKAPAKAASKTAKSKTASKAAKGGAAKEKGKAAAPAAKRKAKAGATARKKAAR